MKKAISLITSIAVLLAIAGCAPATMQGLRANPGGHIRFEVAKNYQGVYRTILANSRRCYQGGMITAQVIVQGDLFTDTKTAEITTALHGGLGVDTYIGVDIKALNEEKTEVRVFYALSSWQGQARAAKAWVERDATDCSVPV